MATLKKTLPTLFILFAFFFNGCSLEKNYDSQVKELVKVMSDYYSNDENPNEDKVEDAIFNFLERNPNTINRSLDSIGINIVTSEDGNFRIYSWDTWHYNWSGTLHFNKTIYQWKSNGKVYLKKYPYQPEADPSFYCSQIFTVNLHNKPCYFAIKNTIGSSREINQSISAYTINGKILNDTVKVFRTNTEKRNNIDVDYDFFSVVDRPERPIAIIKYAKKQQIIYVAVVDETGQVSGKNSLYKLKNNYFEFIGIK